MILSVVFFYLPILYMIIFSFNDGKSLTSFTGFSARWYKHMLESADMMDALSTFSIALLATFYPGFPEETGATVLLENFDSNEQMYIKVANGDAYDILVPSDYMIQRLISGKNLQNWISRN